MTTPESTDPITAAVWAAAQDMYERSTLNMDRCRMLSRWAVQAALPLLLPAIVARFHELDICGGSPTDVHGPGDACYDLASEAIASLIPDRTEDGGGDVSASEILARNLDALGLPDGAALIRGRASREDPT